jgi:LPPG:FO 2-phospho-L-lactate transferase
MKVTALAGGIGASKFLLGLQTAMSPEDLAIVVNTGDDIELAGLRICPDIDTVTYTLAGVANPVSGWGIANDTFECADWLARYGEQRWFNLGDRDLATHIYRTNQLRLGKPLSQVTQHVRLSLGVRSAILPMSESYTPTRVLTDVGELHLQEYFVRHRCELQIRGLRFEAIDSSVPAPGVDQSIRDADVVVLCPSNPMISIGPILAVPGLRQLLRETNATLVVITPIIGGRALKGPTAEMLRDLGHSPTATGVASLYRDFADIFVLDKRDSAIENEIQALGLQVLIADTVMNTLEDKQRLAREVLRAVAPNQ